MKKNHVFRPDAGEGLELRLAPSGGATVAAAIASVDSHVEHKAHEHKAHEHKAHEHKK